MGWSGFQRDVAGSVQLIGIEDALLDRYPVAGLAYAYEIVLNGRSVAPEEVAPTELAIRRLAEGLSGFVVATLRSRRRLVTHVYLSSAEHAEAFAAVPRPRRVSIEVRVEFDPAWEQFALVRPRGVEVQSMEDFAVLGALLEAGDTGRARPIRHSVVGVADDAAAGFLAAIEQLGVSIDYLPSLAGDVECSAVITHDSAPSDVTPLAWLVRGVAERFGARYGGWSCELVTDRPTAPVRRPHRDSPR